MFSGAAKNPYDEVVGEQAGSWMHGALLTMRWLSIGGTFTAKSTDENQ